MKKLLAVTILLLGISFTGISSSKGNSYNGPVRIDIIFGDKTVSYFPYSYDLKENGVIVFETPFPKGRKIITHISRVIIYEDHFNMEVK